MLWYNVGTVAVTLNSKNVTGSGTAWLANVRNGDAFRGPDGQIYLVENVATNTSLTISPAYASATGTGRPYAIVPVQGYQRDLADQVVDLVNSFGATGTAAGGTLTTSPTDSTIGRVVRIADWGFGTNAGVVADPVITNNTANGFYRSGSGTTNGKPVNNSGDAYIKFGWSGAYATYIYGSPISNKLWFKHLNNGADMGWNELMTLGTGGIGLYGAGASTGDVFPAADFTALNVGAGLYYFTSTIGAASNLPFGTNVSDNSGLIVHRQSGSSGGQIVVTASGKLAVRGRTCSVFGSFSEVLRAGDYGFGGAHANPASWEAQKTGWYYRAGTKPAWGGGAFFLDLAYNTTNFNSGLRISTDPYTDNFYMNGAVSGQKTFRDACKLVHDKNIVGDVAAGSVIAQGSNASGQWVRFADGTQICYGGFGFSGSGWKPSSPVVHYPLGFTHPPSVSIQTITDGSGYYTAAQVGMSSGSSSFFIRSSSTVTDSGTSLSCSYIAIGRYK